MGTEDPVHVLYCLLIGNLDLKSMLFAKCAKPSNFFLKTNFLDRSKIKYPSSEPDSFIFDVFYDQHNSAEVFSKSCTSLASALHTSTNFQNALRDAAHVTTSAGSFCFGYR